METEQKTIKLYIYSVEYPRLSDDGRRSISRLTCYATSRNRANEMMNKACEVGMIVSYKFSGSTTKFKLVGKQRVLTPEELEQAQFDVLNNYKRVVH